MWAGGDFGNRWAYSCLQTVVFGVLLAVVTLDYVPADCARLVNDWDPPDGFFLWSTGGLFIKLAPMPALGRLMQRMN